MWNLRMILEIFQISQSINQISKHSIWFNWNSWYQCMSHYQSFVSLLLISLIITVIMSRISEKAQLQKNLFHAYIVINVLADTFEEVEKSEKFFRLSKDFKKKTIFCFSFFYSEIKLNFNNVFNFIKWSNTSLRSL